MRAGRAEITAIRRSPGSRLLVLLAATVVSAMAPASTELAPATVPVPGGTGALVRLLGPIDQDPEVFLLDLNRLLLGTTHQDHLWSEVPRRVELTDYLDTLANLRRRQPWPIAIGTADRASRRAFAQLADSFGFELAEDPAGGVRVVPRGGSASKDLAQRRMAAQALDLRLGELAARSGPSGTVLVEIAVDEVAAPIGQDAWRAMTGTSLGEDALATLARDQRLSLVLDGRRRLSEETRRSIDTMDLRALHRGLAMPFRRYAASFEIQGGELRVPGGDAALAAWAEVAATSPAAPEPFLRALLAQGRARGAYLWHALRFAPPMAADHYLSLAAGERGRRFLRDLTDRIARASAAGHDGSLALDHGFAALARGMPIDGEPRRLSLPGGPGLWLAAIEAGLPPVRHQELTAIVAQGSARGASETDFLLQALGVSVDRPGPDKSALPRLIRAANLVWQHPSLYTPETVVMIVSGADLFEPSLGVLDDLELESPETARDYLLTVARLYRLDLDWRREQLLLAFQGGVEWLRLMARAGRVDAGSLERHLRSWSSLHAQVDDPAAAAPAQLRWVAAVLRQLPAAAPDEPGRGPLERAMLRALVPDTGGRFTWKGIEYESDRSRQLQAGMLESLELFEIPEADHLAQLDERLAELAKACGEQNQTSARRAAEAIRELAGALPGPALHGVEDSAQRARLGNPDRQALLDLAEDVLRRRDGAGLARLGERAGSAPRHLAADLRPFLLAPAYLAAIGDRRGSLLSDGALVRKHRLTLGTQRSKAWSAAALEREGAGGTGAFLCGHVATVEAAISSYGLSSAQVRSVGGLDQKRARAWQRHWASTRWEQLDPSVTEAVAKTVALGWAVLDSGKRAAASGEWGPALEATTRLVPFARLEAEALRPQRAMLSPSEAFMVGLAELESASPADTGGGGAEAQAAARAATAALGPDWRQALVRAGLATPLLNGKASPWIGPWPSYEAVEYERFVDALAEREMVDLHVAVLDYLGRHRLPGFVGGDLMRRTIEDLAATLELANERDWESVMRRARGLDDAYFEDRMRECLRQGIYRLHVS